MTHIGERIRARRGELGMSQGRLAEAAGITASAVSQIESGAIRNLKSETLNRLVFALQTTALELTAGLGAEKQSLPADELLLLEAYRSLPESFKLIAHKLIKALQ
ncbi:helix-turn-helix domain-containing protein [Comamonas aquatilis]|uniref:helix-turn-helix domain-containing protein n=1 Tax=Comamonas aquatilis TaxID=1778406 RepID=UPI0039EF2C30